MNNGVVWVLSIGVIGFGSLFGYVVSVLPKIVAMLVGGCGSLVVLFFGMVLYAYYVRHERGKIVDEASKAIAELKQRTDEVSDKEGVYSKLASDLVKFAAYRVAIIVVEKMIHGLNNAEQRQAALSQVRKIVEDELKEMRVETVIAEALNFDQARKEV